MIKSNPCKLCSSTYHTAAFCPQKPKKPIKRAAVKRSERMTKEDFSKEDKKKNNRKKAKKEMRSGRVKELDRVFSMYIRLRDASNGCVTCGAQKPWQEMQNCHFYSRGKIPTRWDETNCHSGCYRCNILLKGNYIEYTKYMIDRYGRKHVDELGVKANSGEKITTVTIREMIEYYEKVVKNYLQT